MQTRFLSGPLIFPRAHVGEILVVAQRFPIRRLEFAAKMAAARFTSMQRIEAEQLGKFEKVGDAPVASTTKLEPS